MTDSCQTFKSESGDHFDLITCGHSENTFTDTCSKTNENICQDNSSYEGKRIDYILYKLLNRSGCHRSLECKEITGNEHQFQCFAERIYCLSKDPITGISFSDHQPVAVQLIIKKVIKSSEGNASHIPKLCHAIPKNNITNSCLPNSEMLRLAHNNHIIQTHQVIRSYLNTNNTNKQRATLYLMLLTLSLLTMGMTIFLCYQTITLSTLTLWSLLVFLFFIVSLSIINIVFRLEQNGIRSILSELEIIFNSKQHVKQN